jgi:cell division protein FtsZ
MEGRRRSEAANKGIKELSQFVDSLITIPNEKLLSVLGRDVSLLDAFKSANDVLLGAVQGIADLITRPGLINVDFADVRTVMKEMGMAMMGTGRGSGPERARIAAESAIASPLLEDVNIAGARGILVNITAGPDMKIGEFDEVGTLVKNFASDNATVVVGTVLDPNVSDELRVTVVATGLGREDRTVDHPAAVTPPVGQSVPVMTPVPQPAPIAGKHAYAEPAELAGRERTLRKREARAAVDYAENPNYLDIPAFLRRQAD